MYSLIFKDNKLIRLYILSIFSALFILGCSDSGESQSPSEIDAVNDETINTIADDGTSSNVSNTTDVVTTDNSQDTTTDDTSITPIAGESEPATLPPDTFDPTTVTADPVTTRIEFDITVPAYQSNALQVRLQWGDRDTSARFVVDESWAVVDDDRWDNDGDGVSNIEELISGSDPTQANTIADANPGSTEMLLPVSASIELIPDKTFRIRWQPNGTADFYRVLENPDGVSGFTAVSGELDASTEFYDHRVGLHQRVNARYMVEACNSTSCTLSAQQLIEGNLVEAIGYLKASTLGRVDRFGSVVSVSGDGNTLAVGAPFEDSAALGINGDQGDGSTQDSGAVYVYTRSDNGWQQQAYLKASNTDVTDLFGTVLSLSADGNTLAVGVFAEDSNARGVNGDQTDNSARSAGAVYVFLRNGDSWQQQAYLKASTSDGLFGRSVSLSADGNTLAVGAASVYVFVRSSGTWQQQAHIVGASTSNGARLGRSVSLSTDGSIMAVGAESPRGVHMFERSGADWQEEAVFGNLSGWPVVSLSGDGKTVAVAARNSATIFENIGGGWQEQAQLPRFGLNSNTNRESDGISLSADGNTLALGWTAEGTPQRGLQGFQGLQPLIEDAGAVFVYTRGDGTWLQEVYVKASNTSSRDLFGGSVSLSANGDTLAVGANLESGESTGFNGDQTEVEVDDEWISSDAVGSGAVYLY